MCSQFDLFQLPAIMTFDLLTPKADRFMLLLQDYLCQLASKSVHSLSKHSPLQKFGKGRIDVTDVRNAI